jgi:DNA polymerase III subunit gamma/tau
MPYQVLARKYRPQRFGDVIGQDHVTRTLQNAIAQGRIAHGYIFSGHRGIGKTTVARILAMALNCRATDQPSTEPCGVCDSCVEIRNGNSVDVLEIDAATNRGIDEVRELRDAARYRPARDRYKIWILDEAHQITDAAFNALLKTLEEPPSHVVFMMATTQPEDIPQTIRSRCQHFSFHAVKFDEIVGQLRGVAAQENIAADDDAIAILAEIGDGSMRDALSIMDQAIACCGDRLTADLVRGLIGSVSSDILEEVMGAVHRGSSQDVLAIIDRLLTTGQSPTHFTRQLVRFMRNALVAKVAGGDSQLLQISDDERARVTRVSELFSEEDLTRFLQILLRTHSELGYKQEQRFHLELGLMKLVHAARLLPLEQLLSSASTSGASHSAAPVPSGASGGSPQGRSSLSRSQEERSTGASNRSGSSGAAPAPRPSPFAADIERRSNPAPAPPVAPKPKLSAAPAPATPGPDGNPFASTAPVPRSFAPAPSISAAPAIQAPVILTSSAPATAAPRIALADREEARRVTEVPSVSVSTTAMVEAPERVAPAPEPEPAGDDSSPNSPLEGGVQSADALRDRILGSLEEAGQNTLATLIGSGACRLNGSEFIVEVPRSQAIVDMALGQEGQSLLNRVAAAAAGHALRVKLIGVGGNGAGANGSLGGYAPRQTNAPAGSVRARAADDPIVKRVLEKFNAEIRTVLDHRQKR